MPPSVPRAISREDDDTEVSPEPSPLAPPPPFPGKYHQHLAATKQPWRTPSGSRGEEDEDGNNSIPSIPDVPSPYSPPPASLFSGEEWPTTQRKTRPPREVRTSRLVRSSPPSSTDTLDYEDDNSNNNSDGRFQDFSMPGTPATQPSSHHHQQLLPAVLGLKKDLQDSHQSLYLLQQENKALASECDRFQQQLQEWQGEAEQDRTLCEQERNSLETQVRNLLESNERLGEENAALQNRVSRLEDLEKEMQTAGEEKAKLLQELEGLRKEREVQKEAVRTHEADKRSLETELLATKTHKETLQSEQRQLLEQVQSFESEIRDMRSKLKKQAMEAAERLRATRGELQAAEEALRKENESLRLEVDRLKAMLNESQKTAARTDGETSTKLSEMQKEIQLLQSSLQKANVQSNHLRAQKMALRKELADKTRPHCGIGCQTDTPPSSETHEIAVQTDAVESNQAVSLTETRKPATGTSLTQRLSRIRDAAERAAMVQERRHEVERLARDRDDEIKRLVERHDADLKDVVNQAKDEVHTRVKDYKRRLKVDYDSRVSILENKQRAEIQRVQCHVFNYFP